MINTKNNIMLQTLKNSGDKLLVCPHDKNHVMLASRYENHVRKCSMKHAVVPDVCPFNAKHHVLKGELRQHLESCPDKDRLANDIAYHWLQKDKLENKSSDNNIEKKKENERLKALQEATNEECWDNEIDENVKPSLHYRPNRMVYTNMTPSERKREREELLNKFKEKLKEENNTGQEVDPDAKKIFDFGSESDLSLFKGMTAPYRQSSLMSLTEDIDHLTGEKFTNSRFASLGRGVSLQKISPTITDRFAAFSVKSSISETDNQSTVFETGSTKSYSTYASRV